ncbi:hypothetical protein SDC9_27280 [bioreactor metagenome]|uniref:Ferrous iron transporter FeoA-like domain-containing protein n=1 Tax=bioreactor metagenome TaxID=1076179 RepID=A0A644URP5_9ZZZZ|nr:FeoA domain-containing protein [Desulfovibrio desulfuricans]MEA4991630.1 FeoA family protein [Desulfovibrio desulfuricans]UIA98846.1 ferrous iron transport protein A [Desulfovibrio desulfuricans]
MVLAQMPQGDAGKIESIRSRSVIARRLASLGLLPGCHVRVLRKRKRGAVLLEYRGTFLAVSHGIAEEIQMAEVEEAMRK